MAINLSSLNIKITASSAGVVTAANQAAQAVQGLGKNVSSQNNNMGFSMAKFNEILTRTIALYSVFRGVAFIKDSIFDTVKIAAEAEQTEITLGVLFGSIDEAKKKFKELFEVARASSLLQFPDVTDAAVKLKAGGLPGDKIVATIKALGDVASATGADFKHLAFIYTTSFTEGRLVSRDLFQLTQQNIPIVEQLAKQFGLVDNATMSANSQVRKLASENKIFFSDLEQAVALMTSEGGIYYGVSEAQAESALGNYRALTEEIFQLKLAFGTSLIPTLKNYIKSFRVLIQGTDEGATSLKNLQEAGELAGIGLRLLAGFAMGTYSVVLSLNAGLLSTIAAFYKLRSAASGGGFEDGAFDDAATKMQERSNEAFKTSKRLFDLSKDFFETPPVMPKLDLGKSLAEQIGTTTEKAAAASNKLKMLTSDSQEFAQSLRDDYKTPLEEFEVIARKIAEANILGALTDSEMSRFLSSEAERLNVAAEKLSDTLNLTPGFLKGSQEFFEASFRGSQPDKPGAGGAGGANPAGLPAEFAEVFARLKEEAAAQITELQGLASATASLEVAIVDLKNAILKPNNAPNDAPKSTPVDDPRTRGMHPPRNNSFLESLFSFGAPVETEWPVGNDDLGMSSIGDWFRSFGPTKRDVEQGFSLEGLREAVRAMSPKHMKFTHPDPNAPLSAQLAGNPDAGMLAAKNRRLADIAKAEAQRAEDERDRQMALQDEDMRAQSGEFESSGGKQASGTGDGAGEDLEIKDPRFQAMLEASRAAAASAQEPQQKLAEAATEFERQVAELKTRYDEAKAASPGLSKPELLHEAIRSGDLSFGAFREQRQEMGIGTEVLRQDGFSQKQRPVDNKVEFDRQVAALKTRFDEIKSNRGGTSRGDLMKEAMGELRTARQEELKRSGNANPIQPGIANEVLRQDGSLRKPIGDESIEDIVRSMRDAPNRDGIEDLRSVKQKSADRAADNEESRRVRESSADTKQGSKEPTANAVEKLQAELAQQAAKDRGLLLRIAQASEKQTSISNITIVEHSA